MGILDDRNTIDPSTVPYARKAFNQGLIGALALIAIGLIFQLSGLVQPGKTDGMAWLSLFISLAAMGYFIYATANNHKNEDLGGYISYGRAFGVGILVVLTIAVVSMVWMYIYMAYIDPGLIETIREGAVEQMVNQQGMSESQAEELMENNPLVGFFTSPFGIAISSGLNLLIFGLIIDAIIAAVVKKDNPAFA